MIKKHLLFVILLMTTMTFNTKCTSFYTLDSYYYKDQDRLMISHDPDTDARLIINTKYAVIFTPNLLNEIDSYQLDTIFSTIIRGVNIFNLHIDGHADVLRKLNKNKNSLKSIALKIKSNQPLSNRQLATLGKKLNYDILFIPVVDDFDISSSIVYETIDRGDQSDTYYWPPFQIEKTQRTAAMHVTCKVFDVQSGSVIDEIKNSGDFSYTFDTRESHRANLRAIRTENIRRTTENRRRRREFERQKRKEAMEKARRKKNKKKESLFKSAINDLFSPSFESIKIDLINMHLPFVRDYYTSGQLYSNLTRDTFWRTFTFFMKQYDGKTIEGDTANGSGTFQYHGQDKYTGNWNNYNAHGKGTFYYKNGAVLEGAFMNGYAHGPGKYTDSMGNIFIGTYKNGLKNGPGTYYSTTTKRTYNVLCKNGFYKSINDPKSTDTIRFDTNGNIQRVSMRENNTYIPR